MEATLSAFGLGGTISHNERQTVDGHFGARCRRAKCHPGDGHFVHIMVSLCVAGTLASPRCYGVRLDRLGVGSANVALLIFIPSSVTSIFELLPRLLFANILAS